MPLREGRRPTGRRLLARLRRPSLGFVGKLVLLPALVGVAGGLAAYVFVEVIDLLAAHLLTPPGFPLGVEGESARWIGWRSLLVLAIPAAGGFVSLWLTLRFAPEAKGHGTEQLVKTFHERGGKVRAIVVPVKTVASAVTIGSGGSAGQEGPVAQIGGGVGSLLADAFRLTERERRTYLLAGASAGIGAAFYAPLGGALFPTEVLYRKAEFEGEAIIPCIVASIVAYTVRTTITGEYRVVPLSPEVQSALRFDDWRQLGVYLALALLCTLVGLVYVRAFGRAQRAFERLPAAPRALRGALGGLLLGGLALAIGPIGGTHGILFGGYELLRASIGGQIALQALLVLIAGKILATCFTLGSGGSGGLFAPSLAIGAMLGAAVGQAADRLLPGLPLEPASFAFVGMGGFFAGVAKTPIASIILVSEMTGTYELLPPLMLVSVLHMLFARGWGIYETQVPGIVDSPAHAGEFVVDVLERMKVGELLEGSRPPTLVPEATTMRKALEIVSKSRSTYFPVVDREGHLVGIFGLTDIRRIFQEQEVLDLVIVRDFMVEDVVTVTPDDGLDAALQKLNERGLHQIPVVDREDPRRVVAMLTRNNIGAAYHQRLRELKRAGAAG